MPTVTIDAEKCTGCSTCEEICPMNVFVMGKEDKKAHTTEKYNCIGCHACESQCDGACITIND